MKLIIAQNDFSSYQEKLQPYLAQLAAVAEETSYRAPESSVSLLGDTAYQQAVEEIVKTKKTANLKYVLVVGIGGSSLGPKAIYDAVNSESGTKLVFLENIDAQAITWLGDNFKKEGITLEQFVVVLTSKSGTTTESLVNFELLVHALSHYGPALTDRIIVVTDRDSVLWQAAEAKHIAVVEIPKQVGGRFSVFSAVGLLPLGLIGVDVKKLLDSAKAMLAQCVVADENNPALQSAAFLHKEYAAGRTIHETFLFEPRFETVGKWYRQLAGESLGKEKEVAGELEHYGITPVVSIGTMDLHSIAQLDLAGPLDKTTSLVWVEPETKTQVPMERLFSDIVPVISGKEVGDIRQAIFGGVRAAYAKRAIPCMEIILPADPLVALGAFMQWKMIETMLLAKLFDINAFDQPAVEEYKAETRRLL